MFESFHGLVNIVKDVQIELMQEGDWEAVCTIYKEGIATGNATFETEVPDWEIWDKHHFKNCRFIASKNHQIVGWSALSPASPRAVYQGVAEVSVYITASAQGKGIGKALLLKLIEESEEKGIWTLQAGVFPENNASIALHTSCGFREVGRRERLGQLNNVWRDVVLLERRSPRTGRIRQV